MTFLVDKCSMSVYLAYCMATYCIASVVYLLVTFGLKSRPFHDSLTRKQKHILQKSKKKRRNVFLLGCLIGIAILFYFAPFSQCHTKSQMGSGVTHHQQVFGGGASMPLYNPTPNPYRGGAPAHMSPSIYANTMNRGTAQMRQRGFMHFTPQH